MVKLSVSIPDDIYQAILNTIPEGTPFSQGLTALIRKALNIPEDPRLPVVIGNTKSITEVTPEIHDYILELVRSEIYRINLMSSTTIINSSSGENDIEVPIPSEETQSNEFNKQNFETPVQNQEESPNELLNPSIGQIIESEEPEWITQSDIVKMLPESILLITRKGKVSKAVASGKMITNGLAKTECRILRSSALKWIGEVIG